ncbi:MAG TPA: 3-oxoacyl-[acyl-carrier-protein] reductase [Candidatus Limnocylindrales bacterium]|nr:3-oxoacyl-[acyl-carrier-protein] reductase [Candidatus Limnocylindrales bacterium]
MFPVGINVELEGKVSLVTGGSRGIGREIALVLAEAGSEVIVIYRNQAEKASEVVKLIEKMGRKAQAIQTDVSQSEEIHALVERVTDEKGRIDILVNNAGMSRDTLLPRMKEEDWNQVLNVNLTGVFNCTKAVSKVMLKQRSGRIVNMTSIVGVIGNPGQAAYAAAKAGIIGFTKTIAKELASRGITVNAVAPGFIETDMTLELSDKTKSYFLSQIPLQRFGTPRDVAEVVRFLVSDKASYITGQVIHVNGGMYM